MVNEILGQIPTYLILKLMEMNNFLEGALSKKNIPCQSRQII